MKSHSKTPQHALRSDLSTIRIFGTADDSIVDGPGIRFSVFAQGCPFSCPGCHNPLAQPPLGGKLVTVDALMQKIEANPLLAGITLSGGEPFLQAEPFLELARRAKARGLSVWAYSGYVWEELMSGVPSEAARELLREVDVLVDGLYVEAEASYQLKWRGSANQRIIDVPASLAAHTLTELEL
ncbi:MAG: anaerobic ribonucleoside-triphosphate reductase activating protein [Coriobacteriia bacterium]|nr:anaerobic ribonucleoside-triphosphate reductase activating protein [Coriobacteriia bacterium]MCL2751097.1 anaerobic ribonucleoside-triphosphate reductase activating protein [Coriobacteriia bacterium]